MEWENNTNAKIYEMNKNRSDEIKCQDNKKQGMAAIWSQLDLDDDRYIVPNNGITGHIKTTCPNGDLIGFLKALRDISNGSNNGRQLVTSGVVSI